MPRTAAAPTFRCDTLEVAGDVARVGLIARTDAPALDGALRRAQAAAAMTILDARAVTAIDPAVLHLIRAADRRARDQGRRLVILRGSGSIDSDLEALGLRARSVTIEEPPPPAAGSPVSFEVATAERADRAFIKVFGELDIATGPLLGLALTSEAARGRSILLDLSGVEFMDATGIRLLIEAHERAREDGRSFELITGEAVDHTLTSARLNEHFTCVQPRTG
jgi:anti-sigma B factor antagonist